MSAVAIRDLNVALSNLQLETRAPATRSRGADAQMGVRELEALRKADFVAPPEAAEDSEPLVGLYQGRPATGDQLRLPQVTAFDGYAMQAAITRVLNVDSSNAGPAVLKMNRVLEALQVAAASIENRAGTSHRG